MEENEKVVLIDFKDYPKGMANPAVVFIFSLFTWLFLPLTLGWWDASANLAMGLIMLACYGPYLYGGISCIQKGDTITGAIFLVFTGCFSGAGGIQNLLGWYSAYSGVPVDFTIFGWLWVLCAIIIVPCCIGIAKGPWVPFVMFSVAVPELFFLGLSTCGVAPAVCSGIACVCFVIVGTLGMYTAFSGFAAGGGVNVPLGKPLFK